MDTDQQAEELRRDVEALEQTAERAVDRFARRVTVIVLGTAAVVALAWFMGRKARDRAERRH